MNGSNHVGFNQADGSEEECPDSHEVACAQCKLHGFLKFFEESDLIALNIFLSRRIPVAKGAILFDALASFRGIYAVKSGSFKSFSQLDPSGEQIQGFFLPGELIGLDSIHSSHYGYSAVAMETSSVCWLPFEHLDDLGERKSFFQEQVIRILVDQVRHDHHQTLLVGRRTAEERLGAFLLNLSERYGRHGFNGEAFRLPMLQNDIANYLGLSMETVCRLLRGFREQGVLSIQGKRLRILNPDCLRSIAHLC
ncbi:Fumarate and nitrate reduction regulatory protein [Candidatus Magnetaquicoccaceae bacterium FCR-1]|uniref:Fumarate and nitrate reduction regulatory protein n=1 Tax=Candidatus Magnetaquiglobus chichijimensis TaxID=3141448 RepID=A0ABQ0C6Y8_9PROT